MALTEESGGGIPATMLVSPTGGMGAPYPVYMGGGNGGNSGGWDNGNGWWIILLFILLASGNWGNNGNGNGGGMFSGAPIVVNDGGGNVQRGFDQAAIMSGINGVQSGVQNLSTQLCNCCGDIQMALCNGFSGVEQGANARAMAEMNRSFALQSQLADCCCENRLATADLKYTIATEECATRSADAMNTRDIVDSVNRNGQIVLDKLCQLELDAKSDKIADLERQLTMANLAASQTRQTTDIQNSIISELRACPIPAQPVYGSQPIFTCPNNSGCGCGCGNNF